MLGVIRVIPSSAAQRARAGRQARCQSCDDAPGAGRAPAFPGRQHRRQRGAEEVARGSAEGMTIRAFSPGVITRSGIRGGGSGGCGGSPPVEDAGLLHIRGRVSGGSLAGVDMKAGMFGLQDTIGLGLQASQADLRTWPFIAYSGCHPAHDDVPPSRSIVRNAVTTAGEAHDRASGQAP